MEKTLDPSVPSSILGALPHLLHFPSAHFSVDYDRDADVLYISFQRPQQATTTDMTDDGILYRYCDDQLVGVTVLEASTRTPNLA